MKDRTSNQPDRITESPVEARQGEISPRHPMVKVLTTSTILTGIALVGAAVLFMLFW